MEATYVMVKPHFANYKNIINLIENRIIKAGLRIAEKKYIKYSPETAREHYVEHYSVYLINPEKKAFYPELEDYICSDIAFGMIVYGDNAIQRVREIVKQVRIDVPVMLNEEPSKTKNVMHASDKISSALEEMKIFNKLPAISIKNNETENNM